MKEVSIFFTTLFTILILVNYYNKNKDLIILKGSDNRKYRLLDLEGKEECLNILVKLNNNVLKLISLLKEEIKTDKIEEIDINEIKTLIKNYNPYSLNENLENRSLTAYSLNKGEEICLCLREPHNELIIIKDINTLMFVLIHELSHLMTTEYGHTDKFWKNMTYLLKKSNEVNIYDLIDYKKYPVKYCGVNINQTPLFF
mgnify:CR=1 FL=1|tara:strand:- start:585 stop:1184 length:600 start_codon:yes stop_codon:yes gene_type:complete